MFVVNNGRGSGFLRCQCGYAKLLKNTGAHQFEVKNATHRTPYNQPCTANAQTKWKREDLAHEFAPMCCNCASTCQFRCLLKSLMTSARRGEMGSFARWWRPCDWLPSCWSLHACSFSGTSRLWRAGHPEVVLYDSVPGGAGYCQLVNAHTMCELLEHAMLALDCPAGCFTPAVHVCTLTTIRLTGTK